MAEIVLAGSILVVALLGIASVLPTSKGNVHRAGQISKAAWLAQEMVEMIKNDPFTQILLYNGVDTRTTSTYPVDNPIPPVSGAVGNFSGGSNVTKWANDIALYLATGSGITGGYGTITISTVTSDGSGNPILRKISVVINWTEGGRSFSTKLETLASGI